MKEMDLRDVKMANGEWKTMMKTPERPQCVLCEHALRLGLCPAAAADKLPKMLPSGHGQRLWQPYE